MTRLFNIQSKNYPNSKSNRADHRTKGGVHHLPVVVATHPIVIAAGAHKSKRAPEF